MLADLYFYEMKKKDKMLLESVPVTVRGENQELQTRAGRTTFSAHQCNRAQIDPNFTLQTQCCPLTGIYHYWNYTYSESSTRAVAKTE